MMAVTRPIPLLKLMLPYLFLILTLLEMLTGIAFGHPLKEGPDEDLGRPVHFRLVDKRMRARLQLISDPKRRTEIEAAIRRFGSPAVETDRQIAERVIVLADGDPILTGWVLFFVDAETRSKWIKKYTRTEDLPVLANLLYNISLPDWYMAVGGEKEGASTNDVETLFQQIHLVLGIAVPEGSIPSSRRRSDLLKWLEALLLRGCHAL